MARYNREFLVPYLRDVCALHLAYMKLNNRCNRFENQIGSLQNGKYNPKPSRPCLENEVTLGRVIALLIFGFCTIVCVIMFFGVFFNDSVNNGMAFVCLFCGVICGAITAVPIGLIKEGKEENEKREAEYKRKLDEYYRIEEENRLAKNNIPTVRGQLANYQKEKAQVSELLTKAYRANVIPRQYRNIYVAVYLYDWFGTSMADDLDHALSMFVLEEIKAKLDRIIENQKEIIFNQYQIASNQQKFMEQQQRHSAMMHAKLDQIQANNEERNAYLHMIESNTATTAFFATADYIRRI